MNQNSLLTFVRSTTTILEQILTELSADQNDQTDVYAEINRHYRESRTLLAELPVLTDHRVNQPGRVRLTLLLKQMETSLQTLKSPGNSSLPERTSLGPGVTYIDTLAAVKARRSKADAPIQRKAARGKGGYTKSPAKNLRIRFENGPTIERKAAKEAFADAIVHMGIEAASQLGITTRYEPLISTRDSENPLYASRQIRLGKYRIFAYTSTEEKKAFLETIAGKLGYKIHIDLIPQGTE